MSAILREVPTAATSAWSPSRMLRRFHAWMREEADAPAREASDDRFDVEGLVRNAGRERADMLTGWSQRLGD